tara:strand:+ start:1006 stop:2265 length:1260 start_codon:yes stop_codon:yes gene_type:complete
MSITASIIITNYNYGKYISKCIRSCINQSYDSTKYEIIIVDDCSKDNSLDLVKEYKKSFQNLVFIKNKKNIGVSKSANRGLSLAKGKYVVRVDADDYINREFLKVLILFLEENQEYFSVSCDYYLVDKSEKKISRLSYQDRPISCGIMYTKNKLKKLGGYNPKFKHREEEELRQRIKENNLKNFNINLPLYRYLRHKSNKTNSKSFKKIYRDKINKLTFKKNFTKFKSSEDKFLKNITVIIPARLNSKRLKNKNLKKIWGKPMIHWSIKAAKKSNYVKQIYVSSENDKVLKYSKYCGVKYIKRPSELSKDNVYKIDVIRHAVKKIKTKPSLVISLQPNSPDVLSSDIDRGIEKLIRYNLNEIISTDSDGIQNAAFRIMKYESLFQKSLSTYCGFVITDSNDIHSITDFRKVEKNKTYEN